MKTQILLLAPMFSAALLGTGEARAQSALLQGSAFSAGSFPQDVAAADLNGDGLTDLIVANQLSSTVSVYLAQAGGGYLSAGSSAVGAAQRLADARCSPPGSAWPAWPRAHIPPWRRGTPPRTSAPRTSS